MTGSGSTDSFMHLTSVVEGSFPISIETCHDIDAWLVASKQAEVSKSMGCSRIKRLWLKKLVLYFH